MRNIRKSRLKTTIFIVIILLVIVFITLTTKIGEVPNDKIYYDNNVKIISSNIIDNNSSKDENDNWKLILVNPWNPIPDDYTFTPIKLKDNYQVDERIYPDLQEMFDDARNDGVYPHVNSAYRTKKEQKKLMTDKINAYIKQGYSKKEANELAKNWVATPGTSEHEIGLALDINAQKSKSTNNEVYNWLNKNCYKYGFILRYPTNKVKITGVHYEPWHYRYVGKEVAKEIYEQGICLEEYLDK